MLQRLWHWIPSALRNRPFGMFTSILIWGVGMVGILGGNAYDVSITPSGIFTTIISIYFVVAATTVIMSLMVDRKHNGMLSIFGEMYGWLFIAAAALAELVLFLYYIYSTGLPPTAAQFFLWILFWFILTLASLLRSLDILINHRET